MTEEKRALELELKVAHRRLSVYQQSGQVQLSMRQPARTSSSFSAGMVPKSAKRLSPSLLQQQAAGSGSRDLMVSTVFEETLSRGGSARAAGSPRQQQVRVGCGARK